MIEENIFAVSPSSFYWQLYIINWITQISKNFSEFKDFHREMQNGLRKIKLALRETVILENHMDKALNKLAETKANLEEGIKSMDRADKHI
jgi:hypothetical protein